MSYPRDERGWTSRLLAESRALYEIGAGVALHRHLPHFTPLGDGHPVMLLPGFTASDRSMVVLRRFLHRCDYRTNSWGEGRNTGLCNERLGRLEQRLQALAERRERPVSLIGWSAGGLYARALAHRQPEHVRLVITLGTPFKLNRDNMECLPDGLHELHQRLNPAEGTPGNDINSDHWNTAPPVPSTSLFSRSDALAPWPMCLDRRDNNSENIQVPGSHAGMTFNPVILYVIADRLAQKPGDWRPFRMKALRRVLFRHDCASRFE